MPIVGFHVAFFSASLYAGLVALYVLQIWVAYLKGRETLNQKGQRVSNDGYSLFHYLKHHDEGHKGIWVFVILAIILPVFLNSMSDLISIIDPEGRPTEKQSPKLSRLQNTLNRPEVQELVQSPEFLELVQSPEFLELMQSPELLYRQDYLGLLQSSRFREPLEFRLRQGFEEVLQSPEFLELVQSPGFLALFQSQEYRERVQPPESLNVIAFWELLVKQGSQGRSDSEAQETPEMATVTYFLWLQLPIGTYFLWLQWFYYVCLACLGVLITLEFSYLYTLRRSAPDWMQMLLSALALDLIAMLMLIFVVGIPTSWTRAALPHIMTSTSFAIATIVALVSSVLILLLARTSGVLHDGQFVDPEVNSGHTVPPVD